MHDRSLSTSTDGPKEWILGVDVGDRSVGMAAVEFENGLPSQILTAVSVIHDGGVGNPKYQTSRLAEAGMARRVRRLRRRRQSRLRKVDRLVERHGWVLPPSTSLSLLNAWEARRRLVEETILDEKERAVLLGRAITHMARHRGWRNPWLPVRTLWDSEVPSTGLVEAVQNAEDRFGVTLEPGTLGQLGALLSQDPNLRMHPQRGAKQAPSLLSSRARQEDVLWELRLIAKKQGIADDVLRELADAIFGQHPVTVPKERIGRDPFDPNQLRAPVASLEFQEFRIRDKVANLRIREGRNKRLLTLDERQQVVKALMGSKERLTWAEVALDVLGLANEGLLAIPEEHGYSSLAPRDDTAAAIESWFATKGKALKQTRQWWAKATRTERAALVRLLTNEAGDDELDVALQIPKEELEELGELARGSLQSGRAAYGLGTLQKLNDAMSGSMLDLHGAIKACFDVGDDWRPPLPRLDEPTGQPTVDRNLAAVRKFLSAATLRWGLPSRIVVELAREGERTPAKLQEQKRERARRQGWNDRLREELRQSGISEPRRADLVKHTLLSMYDNTCLYCGNSIAWDNSEIDHIVPRADGGVNRLENLAVVCLHCNRAKGRQPFGLWAKQQGIDLNAVLDRVRALPYEKGSRWSSERELRAYKKAVKARLRRVTADPEEVRSIAPTSYAAVALAERLRSFMVDNHGNDGDRAVAVVAGGVTAEARRVLGLSVSEIFERSGHTKRLDRRHHAVDALVLTTMTPAAMRLLTERSVARREQEFFRRPAEVNLESWEARAASSEKFNAWQEAGTQLVGLIDEASKSDRIAVVRPLRLRPSGKLHEDTVFALQRHHVGDPWTQEQIRRVVDADTYVALSTLAEQAGGVLERDDQRCIPSRYGEVGPNGIVELFPNDRAMMRVSTGAANLESIHHARLYAWKDGSKGYKFAILRVWLADLAICGLLDGRQNVLTSELPPWSQSWRYAHDSLRKAVSKGDAKYLGWLAPGDELEFAVANPKQQLPGDGMIKSFLDRFPERHWFIRSFTEPARIALGPLYLAEEGLAAGEEFPSSVTTILQQGWRPSINTLFSCPDLVVIRRTTLGKPRWKSTEENSETESLPISWKPWQRAAEMVK